MHNGLKSVHVVILLYFSIVEQSSQETSVMVPNDFLEVDYPFIGLKFQNQSHPMLCESMTLICCQDNIVNQLQSSGENLSRMFLELLINRKESHKLKTVIYY